MSREHTAALVNLGCRVNRVELDLIARQLVDAGFCIVGQREAEVIVINTCAVTGEAEAKTRKAIRRAAGMPLHPVVLATGCVANLFADELRGLASNVWVEPLKAQVAAHATELLATLEDETDVAASPMPSSAPAPRVTPTGRTRPGIKVQDGCDNRCSFCIVWKARGHSRSISPEDVLTQVREECASGAREVVLTGINLGNYDATTVDGRRLRLPDLLRLVLDETDVGRIRLSSIEPPDVTDELLDVMAAAGERVAPFLHVCLQSGCDTTLREMRRVYDTAQYRDLVARARRKLPDLALGCDLIVGFPGETDADFEESLAFCREMRFSRMHVFRYSKRPGTPAAEREDQVDPQVSNLRAQRMGDLARTMRHDEASRRVGQEELVLVQEPGRAISGGLFDVLVDDGLPLGTLARVVPTDVGADAVLDARTPGQRLQ